MPRPDAPVPPGPRPEAFAPRALSLAEFVAMIALLAGTVAFSIDAMLPALPEIGASLSPGDPNRAQLVVVVFVLGMGFGTMFVGPISDALGRKAMMLGGTALYCAAAIYCTVAPSLEALLIARFLQGMGGSGPRVAAMAMIRDLYVGRDMAKVSSYVMMVFTLVPAIAPLIGAALIDLAGWRAVFWSFVAFSAVSGTWLLVRQPETLPLDRRRPLQFKRLRLALMEVARHGNVRRAIAVQTLVFGILFATITSVQPIYDITFGRADSFPIWFAIVALLSAGASFLNARLVQRLGMLWLLRRALAGSVVMSVVLAGTSLLGVLPQYVTFPVFVIWQTGSFALAGLTIGNLNAIAMQPMGHIAGMASSVISAVATIAGVSLAAPVGLLFDGTTLPVAVGAAAFGGLALFLARKLTEAGA